MSPPRILILGIGNVLWADEGFGVRCVERFHQRYTAPEHICFMDGGTQGLYLVPHVQECDALIVFDAIDYGLPPGTLKIIEGDDVPRFMGAKKISLHQTGFQEVLSTAELLGHRPDDLLLIGVQPEEIDDYGGSLRAVVRAQIDPAIEVALRYLDERGYRLTPRSEAVSDGGLAHPSIILSAYEQNRPSDDEVFRYGDLRFLSRDDVSFDPKNDPEEHNRINVNLHHRRQD